ncbi:hypothetical protein HPB51_020553 [Rhipicephalus microplus]|uniref:Uncharacterized protein n=1 Tax=Rhipicephalus microplus TaxID=6941 RepID=A0A9J6E4C7_RHIMP|nr:hypothetical protein HPB51_020553 [Rhipicephalus microplus]
MRQTHILLNEGCEDSAGKLGGFQQNENCVKGYKMSKTQKLLKKLYQEDELTPVLYVTLGVRQRVEKKASNGSPQDQLPEQLQTVTEAHAKKIDGRYTSTPSATNAAAYSQVTEIILTDQRHPVMAYFSPAGITSQGVIRGVDTDFDDAALNRMLIQPRNSSLMGARRIKNTETVILIFNGLKVPNYVYCDQVIYHCTCTSAK